MEPLHWATILSIGLSVATFIYAWVTRRDDKADERLEAIEKKIGAENKTLHGLSERMVAVETRLGDMPGNVEFRETKVQLAAIRGQIDVVVEGQKNIKAISERLQEFLLEQSRRRP